MKLQYEELSPISRQKIRHSLSSKDHTVVSRALIRMALHEPDWEWAEAKVLPMLADARPEVQTAALIAIGHLARIHRSLHLDVVLPEIRKLLKHPVCGGVAQDTIDDIKMFISNTGKI